jgi:hypothetical protein
MLPEPLNPSLPTDRPQGGFAAALMAGNPSEAPQTAPDPAGDDLVGEAWEAATGEAWAAVKADDRAAFSRAMANAMRIAISKLGG